MTEQPTEHLLLIDVLSAQAAWQQQRLVQALSESTQDALPLA